MRTSSAGASAKRVRRSVRPSLGAFQTLKRLCSPLFSCVCPSAPHPQAAFWASVRSTAWRQKKECAAWRTSRSERTKRYFRFGGKDLRLLGLATESKSLCSSGVSRSYERAKEREKESAAYVKSASRWRACPPGQH
eukprot:scaffold300_cov258-Pinguiococcus_pyrenoidosus.AAC.38